MAQSWIKEFQKSEDYKNIIQQRKTQSEEKRKSQTSFSILKEQFDP